MNQIRIKEAVLTPFVQTLLCKAGVHPAEAACMAPVFVWMDLIGRRLHGISRLPALIKRLKLGLINSPCDPEMTCPTRTLAIIDGKNGFGQYLGHLAMSEAISMARQHGVGVVGVRGSNHFGAGAYYVHLAANHQQIGIAMSNSVPKVAPFGGVQPVLGTNPFAFGAPAFKGRPILADFSTSAIPGSKVLEAIAEERSLPEGLVVDAQGKSIVDPNHIGNGALLPFGGPKGFCVGLMVEILSGVLTGAGVSHGVASMYEDFSRPANSGHFFVALDLAQFMPLPLYYERIAQLLALIKAAGKAGEAEGVLIPGETRWRIFSEQKVKGVLIDQKTAAGLTILAQQYRVAVPW
ncbi:MAG: Ldh family oxidoreductase [bacterium]